MTRSASSKISPTIGSVSHQALAACWGTASPDRCRGRPPSAPGRRPRKMPWDRSSFHAAGPAPSALWARAALSASSSALPKSIATRSGGSQHLGAADRQQERDPRRRRRPGRRDARRARPQWPRRRRPRRRGGADGRCDHGRVGAALRAPGRHGYGSRRRAASGEYSSSTVWKLVPPKPKALTPARRTPASGRSHSRSSVLTRNGLWEKSMSGFGLARS